jgi:type IV pilus assembly protein PilM
MVSMGLFSRREDAVGLDVGSSAIKLVHLDERPSGYALKALGAIELPPDAIGEGTIKDPPVVVEAIKEVIAKSGVKTNRAVIGLSGHSIIMKKLSLPRVSPKELADAIQIEAEHHVPFDIDDVYLDYQTLRASDGGNKGGGPKGGRELMGGGEMMDVMLVAVKKAKVDEYVAVVEEAGLTVSVVDVDAFALENQFELNNPEAGDEVVALIDVGASVMKTAVVRGGAPLFARDIAVGGGNYTQAIAHRLRIPLEKAEAAKRGDEGQGVRWDDLVPSLEAVSRELSLEIQRTFDYFTSTAEPLHINRIVLSGGGAKLPGLVDFLSSSWGVPVEIVKPFLKIQCDSARFSPEELDASGPLMATAVGLSLRRRGDKPT